MEATAITRLKGPGGQSLGGGAALQGCHLGGTQPWLDSMPGE